MSWFHTLFTTDEAARSSCQKRLSCGYSSAEGDPVFTSLPAMSTSMHFHLNSSVQKKAHDRNHSRQVQGKFMWIPKRTDQKQTFTSLVTKSSAGMLQPHFLSFINFYGINWKYKPLPHKHQIRAIITVLFMHSITKHNCGS